MKLAPPKYIGNAKRELTSEFLGLNVTDAGGEGNGKMTFSAMENGGTDKYPFAASRAPRALTQYDASTCAIYGGEVLARVQPPYLFYGDRQIDLGLSAGEKQIVSMGTDILIFPDGKFFDTVNGDSGDIDAGEVYTSGETDHIVKYWLSNGDYIRELSGSTGTYYCKLDVTFTYADGSVKKTVDAAYSGYNCFLERREKIGTFYDDRVTLALEDGILYYVKECSVYKNESTGLDVAKDVVWQALDVEKLEVDIENTDLLSMSNLWSGRQYVRVSDGYVYILPGQRLSDVVTIKIKSNDPMQVSFLWKTRTLPFFDYVTVHNNRLYGCRKGMPYDGYKPVNRLYVSAHADYRAFEQFDGISTDSWYGDCGEDGPFTGACTYDGHPMFFRENMVYILYGDYPPYSYSKMDIRGVAEGAAKSLLPVDGALFWKSRNDIIRYTGSALSVVSAPLGDVSGVSRAIAGTWKSRYYIAMDNTIFVYDTVRGLWTKEDAQAVLDFAVVKGKMHFLSDDGKVYSPCENITEDMPWSLTSPPIGYGLPNRKYISQLRIRIELAEGAELPLVELSLDGKPFVHCNARVNYQDAGGIRTGTILVPVLPRRCETFRYRLSGIGSYKITGVTKVIEESGT